MFMSNHLYLDITYSCVVYIVYVSEEIWHIVEINRGFSGIYVLNVTKMYVIINKLMANWWLKTILVIPLQN